MTDIDLKKRKLKMKLYINLACDILDIPTPYIHYRMPKNEPNNLGVTYKKRGYYHIYLNAEYPVEAILYNACLHECRHVYQSMVCERKDAYLIEPKEVIDSWMENFTNYKDVFNKIMSYSQSNWTHTHLEITFLTRCIIRKSFQGKNL